MDSKTYLRQAYKINVRIRSKIEQVNSLRDLAEKATSSITGMPSGGSENRMENAIIRMVDLQNEIAHDIESLVQLKQNIAEAIDSIENDDYKTLLELRYLANKKWEEIAVIMHLTIDGVFRVHRRALREVDKINN